MQKRQKYMTHTYNLFEAMVSMDVKKKKINQRKSRNNEIVNLRKLLCISSRLLPSLARSRENVFM